MKKRLMTAWTMMVLALALTGCVAMMKFDARGVAGEGSEKPGMATLVVAKSGTNAYGSAWWMNVSVDGRKVGDVRLSTYVHVSVPPGHHVIQIAFPPMTMTARPLALESDFEADKTYYFVWSANHDEKQVDWLTEHFAALPPDEGRQLVAGMKDRSNR